MSKHVITVKSNHIRTKGLFIKTHGLVKKELTEVEKVFDKINVTNECNRGIVYG